jgi:AraC-like DNA-binding protein
MLNAKIRNLELKESGMSFHFHKPSALLAPFVKSYITVETDEAVVSRVLPDTSIVMALRYSGQVHDKDPHRNPLPSALVSGMRKSFRLFRYSDQAAAILIAFRETGASAFFKAPLHELFEQSVSLDNYFGRQEIADIEDQLGCAQTVTERISIVERFLLSHQLNHKTDALVQEAIRKIHLSNGNYKINALAGEMYISQDAFEKRFRKITGASPKQFASVVRMKNLIQIGRGEQSLTELAYEGGYFDQAHFTKDFKIFTGQTPTDFYKSPTYW